MEKELESVHGCVATKPHGLVCFPRLVIKAVGGLSRMEIDRSYRSFRSQKNAFPVGKRCRSREREREGGRDWWPQQERKK